MLGGSFEGKSRFEDRKAINMEKLEPTHDFRRLRKEKNSFRSATCAVRESAPQYGCILGLQHHGCRN